MWLQNQCDVPRLSPAWCSCDARYASDTSGRSDQGMEAKEEDDNAMKEKKAKKNQAGQQLAASWLEDFQADIEQGKMPDQFSGMHQYLPCHFATCLLCNVVRFL